MFKIGSFFKVFLSYDDFVKRLNTKIKSGDDFYLNLLETIIDNPARYSGIFRLSNAKTKLIQNVTQSREIKFGDFLEEIVTTYLGLLGCSNLDKEIGCDENGDRLSADQVFMKDDAIFLVEQKVRDDHDSTKKRGQFNNFIKKVLILQQKYPNKHLIASMWFIDDAIKKNRKYYQEEIDKCSYQNTELFLHYGSNFFKLFDDGNEVWKELSSHLIRYKLESSDEVLSVPDFGTSDEIYNALLQLPEKYWKKLLSSKKPYVFLRKEIFSSGDNLIKAQKELGLEFVSVDQELNYTINCDF